MMTKSATWRSITPLTSAKNGLRLAENSHITFRCSPHRIIFSDLSEENYLCADTSSNTPFTELDLHFEFHVPWDCNFQLLGAETSHAANTMARFPFWYLWWIFLRILLICFAMSAFFLYYSFTICTWNVDVKSNVGNFISLAIHGKKV